MPRSLIARVAIAVASIAALAAQTPRDGGAVNAPPGSGLISGMVVLDDASPRPLRRVTVTLWGGDVGDLLAITDDNGRFTFRNLRPGRYTLSAARPGYVTAFYTVSKTGRGSTAIALAEGQQVTNVAIRVPRGAVITGTVTTETGEPAREARVTVLVYGFSATTGERTLMAGGREFAGGAVADDRGVYRLFGLAPGDYIVAATQSTRGPGARQTTDAEYQRALQAVRSGAAAVAGFAMPPQTEALGTAPVFFPGTTSTRDAQLVTVAAGEERRAVDFAIRPVPIGRINGTIIQADGQPAPNVPIITVDADGVPGPLMRVPPARVVSDASGRFTLTNIRPGTYSITARVGGAAGGRGAAPPAGPQLYAITDVTTDGRDTTVSLTLRSGVSVAGRVTFESVNAQPAPADLTRTRVTLRADLGAGGTSLGVSPATLDAGGTFSFSGVTPGRYRLQVSAPGGTPLNPAWFVKSARMRGAETIDTLFEVSSDDVGGVEITMTDRPTELSGLMQDAAGQPAPEYFLIAFPQDRSRWVPQSVRIQQVRPAADGRFLFRGLPPGEYFLGALTDIQPGEWYNPAFLQQLSGSAIRLTLAEGEKKVQDIRVR